MMGLMLLAQAEFSRTESGTVIDSQTKLEWQDDYSDNEGNAIKIAWWGEALTYCHNLNLDGTGWRLPNINELKSLIVETQFAPSINSKFINTISRSDENYAYWSSTRTKKDRSKVWGVGFIDGRVYQVAYKFYNGRRQQNVRCVRDYK